MKSGILQGLFVCTLLIIESGCALNAPVDIHADFEYCAAQADKTLTVIPGDSLMPRNIDNGKVDWRFVPIDDWTSGFWPGTLWYLYEATGNAKWRTEAEKFTHLLLPLSRKPAFDHDLGFQIFNSYGNGYRLTGNPEYKKIILRTADTLATLFNPKVGTILSWPRMVHQKSWPHNTIIDNMINLELLFWASKNGGRKDLYDIAMKHAEITMKNHFRPDFTSFHVVIYDTISGEKISGITHQGYADNSMWARGQAWAIYGFTMVYRETNRKEFLEFAQNVADTYLARLPEDLVPYWDFDAPMGDSNPRDASAAAITASALIELSRFVDGAKATQYLDFSEKMLTSLSSDDYRAKSNSSFLLHSTGHKPNGSEVDASIIYADYYYIEALLRLKRHRDGR
jgi:unsaturated chondroitin disaccharide hydrolase